MFNASDMQLRSRPELAHGPFVGALVVCKIFLSHVMLCAIHVHL